MSGTVTIKICIGRYQDLMSLREIWCLSRIKEKHKQLD